MCEDLLPCWPVLLFQSTKGLPGMQGIPVLSKGSSETLHSTTAGAQDAGGRALP